MTVKLKLVLGDLIPDGKYTMTQNASKIADISEYFVDERPIYVDVVGASPFKFTLYSIDLEKMAESFSKVHSYGEFGIYVCNSSVDKHNSLCDSIEDYAALYGYTVDYEKQSDRTGFLSLVPSKEKIKAITDCVSGEVEQKNDFAYGGVSFTTMVEFDNTVDIKVIRDILISHKCSIIDTMVGYSKTTLRVVNLAPAALSYINILCSPTITIQLNKREKSHSIVLLEALLDYENIYPNRQ